MQEISELLKLLGLNGFEFETLDPILEYNYKRSEE